MHAVWRESKVPSEWSDTVLVPIPKKGDLSSCDNWRGITLVDVVGNADDGTLLAGTRSGAERAVQATSSDFGHIVSIPKTRQMVAGREAADSVATPIPVSSGEITSVDEFPYLGSVVAASGRMDADVEKRTAQAS